MKNIIPFFLFALGILNTSTAQDYNKYEPLQCTGKLPKEITSPSSEKYKKDIKRLTEDASSKREKKDRNQFALETNFVLDDLLQSGMVLFNDPITDYVNKVVDKLLTNDDEKMRNKINVYTLRTSAVNAFATERGNVFVTLGMLAQLENEAQLAFILAHELSHVQESHGLDMYLEAKEISRDASRKNVVKRSSFDEAMLKKCHYSKELERDADSLGTIRFLKSPYSTKTINTVFDVLKYSYLPFDEEPFDFAPFESNTYKLPDFYKNFKVNDIKGTDEDRADSISTHPNIASRRLKVNAAMQNTDNTNRLDYVISEEEFNKVQQLARMELPMLSLHNGEIAETVYLSGLLLKKYPESIYLKKCMAKALYLHAKYTNSGEYTYRSKADEIEGESQKVYHLLDTMDTEELNALAGRYIWQLSRVYPKDHEIELIKDDMLMELSKSIGDWTEFQKQDTAAVTTVKEPVKEDKKEETDTKKEKSKYTKIKVKQKEAAVVTEVKNDYWRKAFDEYLKDTTFTNQYAAARIKQEKRDKEMTPSEEAAYRRAKRREEKKGRRMGIDKIAIINPYYLQLDARKENSIQYLGTESGQDNLRSIIETVAKKSNLKVELLDVCDLKDSQTDKFNDIRMLNDWYSEQMDYFDMSLTPGLNQEKINAITEKYGTKYVLWTGVISLREKNMLGVLIPLGIVMPLVLPYTIYRVVNPKYEMLYYAVLFDVKTGRREIINYNFFNKKDSNTLLKAHIYDTLTQIKTAPK